TQGGSFGAQVTLDGLGLTLGHGMSRFDPHPAHPNAPAPGKRPLHNMCPSVALRQKRPAFAIGGAGGVRIPNPLFHIFIQWLVRGASIEQAIAAPRLSCTGTLDVLVENGFPKAHADYLSAMGYKLRTGECAHVSAVSFDHRSGTCRKVMR